MKGLIVAAGRGTRLGNLTRETPKALLKIADQTILHRMLTAMTNCGINEIGLVRGYLANKFDIPSLKYFENHNFEKNNILHSLMCAKDFLIESANEGKPIVVTYSDIVVDESWVEFATTMCADITLICDSNWEYGYIGRDQHPMTEAELVVFDDKNNLQKIGKIHSSLNKEIKLEVINVAEFIGMFYLSPDGIVKLVNTFDALTKLLRPADAFGRSAEFQTAYLSDLFQYMVNAGDHISVATLSSPWFEIDTAQDLRRADDYFSRSNLL
jgi:choline kinase